MFSEHSVNEIIVKSVFLLYSLYTYVRIICLRKQETQQNQMYSCVFPDLFAC